MSSQSRGGNASQSRSLGSERRSKLGNLFPIFFFSSFLSSSRQCDINLLLVCIRFSSIRMQRGRGNNSSTHFSTVCAPSHFIFSWCLSKKRLESWPSHIDLSSVSPILKWWQPPLFFRSSYYYIMRRIAMGLDDYYDDNNNPKMTDAQW